MELTIKNINKKFKDKVAVKNFNLTLNSGVYALLGANGSGKTTLMRILADVSSPTSGEILVNGKNKNELGPNYRDLLGYLPQDVGFYKNFTAEKFLMYVSALKGIDKKQAKVKTDELLKFVNLEAYRHKKIGGFSGGMKQRLGIAQALLNDPKILILDEPTAGLDPNERIRFKNLIANVSKDKIVILSTHIVSDIEFIANEILIMKDGELIERSIPSEITDSIKGKVFTLRLKEENLYSLQSRFKVSNMVREDNYILARVVDDTKPDIDGIDCIEEEPNLEDVFLYYFKEEVCI